MLSRIITVAVLLAAAYWYWTGPYQAQHRPGDDTRLQQDIEAMHQCVRGMNYKVGATGVGQGDPEAVCAERFHVYLYEGEWRRSN